MLYGMLLDHKIINMNNIIIKMHVYSACGPFTRHKERIKEFKRTRDTRLLYRNELDKACFKHDAAYAKYKDVENRLISDQKLRNSAYDIASNPKYDGYQRSLASMVLTQKLLHSTKKLRQVKVMQSIGQSLVI